MATVNSNHKTKDPSAILDYIISWRDWLASGETISSSTWVVPTGITQVSTSNDTTSATIFLSGGELGAVYTITNRIVTNQSRTDDRSLIITIANK